MARTVRLPIHDPGLASLRSAMRAAIVMPAVFAIADRVIGDPSVATFAAFGSFATLVLVEFGGPLRVRAVAYLALGGAGAADVVIGTLCSSSAWLGAVVMAAVGFLVLFSGVINGYFAAAGTAATLPFVLAVMIPAPLSALGPRLEGWALAVVVGSCAQLLLWPPRPQISLSRSAARACRALASLADAALAGPIGAGTESVATAAAAVSALRRQDLALSHRPAGATARRAALNSLVEELDWLLSWLTPPAETQGLRLCEQENVDALAAVAAALRAAAIVLEGGAAELDLRRLDETRRALAQALARRIPSLPAAPDEQALAAAIQPAFRIRILSYGAEAIAVYALAATGRRPSEAGTESTRWERATRPLRSTLRTTEQVAAEHASPRSVSFRNSVRGAAGLALAVYVAQALGLQHAFWVVLGTVSVLRSNALGTGWSIVSALGGTAAGIVVGAAIMLGIGTGQPALWAALPLAVLLASYAPRAISFAAGQAGFTVVLVVLFNIIQPVGWRVGLVRIEDVAIGFAISLGVGLLFWPRGAAALLRKNLASAYARNADYVVAAEHRLVEGSPPTWAAGADHDAATAAHHLDEAYRQYLADRSAAAPGADGIAVLVAGAGRLRRAAQSLAALASMAGDQVRLEGCGGHLDVEVHALREWYLNLGDAVARSTPAPPPHTRDAEGRLRLLDCVRDAIAGSDRTKRRPALNLLWASQHLDALWQLEQALGRHASSLTVPSQVVAGPQPEAPSLGQKIP